MLDSAFSINQALRDRLATLIQTGTASVHDHPAPAAVPADFKIAESSAASTDPDAPVGVVVTINEVNDRHGTGPLVKRVFQGRSNMFSIRSRDDWGVQDFGDWNVCIPQHGKSRAEAFRNVLSVLRGRNVKSVLCIPYLVDELITAIAVKECFNADLCTWIMDDQNVASHNVPDDLMRELLEKSSLRLVTHPELRFAYERKYGLKFHILPAIVPEALVARGIAVPPVPDNGLRKAALIGSFWDQNWFDRFCDVIEKCNCKVDWFGNNKSPWFKFSEESMCRARITPHGVIPEERLAIELRKYPLVIVPAGALDLKDANTGVASLSLPGRILFAIASSHSPVLLMGSAKTCGARFVKQFRLGEVVPYDAALVSAAMDRLIDPKNQLEIRQRAFEKAGGFSDRGVADWLAKSVALGHPVDNRYEDAFAGYDEVIQLPPLAAQVKSAVTSCA